MLKFGDTKIVNGVTYIYQGYGRWVKDLGNQGESFRYNDFTPEQLSSLTSYLHIAYASDASGSDFTFTADETSVYIAFVSNNLETATEADFSGASWIKITSTVQSGEKLSATDAGIFGQISLGDDYVYFCVQSGSSGNAIWKKTVLFAT